MKNILDLITINRMFFGNTVMDYLKAIILFIALLVALKIVESIILIKFKKAVKKTKTDIDDIIFSIIDSIRPRFYIILSLWISIRTLEMSMLYSSIIDSIVVLFIAYQFISSSKVALYYFGKKRGDKPTIKSAIGAIVVIGKIIIWSIVLLLVLSNFGVDITAIIAGLGIGGIAIALAIQGILSDLFSSLSIYLDRPVDIGDFIEFDDVSGVVVKIGIKTTRMQSLNGEEIVVPNQKLVASLIHNYGRMNKRRVVTNIGVEYSTKNENLVLIADVIKNIIVKINGVEFERCHLKNLGDSAIEFESVYYINNTDYIEYMDINQKVLTEIKKELDGMGVSMAFPSQSIYLKK